MLIVTGSLTARPDNYDMFLGEAVAHVRRSRGEDGCLHHEWRAIASIPIAWSSSNAGVIAPPWTRISAFPARSPSSPRSGARRRRGKVPTYTR